MLYLTFLIILIGVFLFVKDYFTIDTTSIVIMSLFIVVGVLSPEEGFSGFNHPATITLGCMFVISAAVFKSGIIDGLSSKIVQIAKINYVFALMIFCIVSAAFSAFINDTAIVAILIPMALMVCRETNIAPSRLLIPISFAALFGGTCTLVGTSTNILVSSIAKKSGLEPFGMFEFSLPALCLLAIGLAYMFFIGPLILPNRPSKDMLLKIEAENYIAEIELTEGNEDIDQTIKECRLNRKFGAQVLSIRRKHTTVFEINEETNLRQGDKIKIMITPGNLAKLQEIKTYKLTGDKVILEDEQLKKIYEVMIPHGSMMAGKTLKNLNFRTNYYASVLALRQRKETITSDVSNVKLNEGDMLLVYTSAENLHALTREKMVVTLSEYQGRKFSLKRAIPTVAILVGVILAAALNITSLLISALIGSLVLVTTTLIKPKEAYEAIEWKVIFMMAGVLSMGKALEKTGGDELISNFIFENIGGLDHRITLSLIFLISFLSTNVLSSKATAALMSPIVISLTAAMQLSYKPFLIAVMFACSLTFMTPVSYPTNTMVYAPGNYKFNDFVKIGTPLNIIIWIAASFIIPLFFPFEV
ncbi:SLC13 family permease [Mesonia sp. K7]|uniref:SLC13 family permease n=1 Tax=Mesonia sp. K7 TaxID=2218606 RepID=UPI000DA7261C|nr:SLC13 family permease [Mesonia sp. K7]PZD78629.1 SLC13 family permease [Mesonia sp. K7]